MKQILEYMKEKNLQMNRCDTHLSEAVSEREEGTCVFREKKWAMVRGSVIG